MSDVTIYYLEMLSADSHQPKPLPADLSISEALIKQYQVNRMLYQLVGEDWEWNDKSVWSKDKCSIAGFFELEQIDPQTNELAYFGLAGKFIGRGFGGALLSAAVAEAWQWGSPQRVIVNTCTLDHPNALVNYKARGFSVYKTKALAS